MSGTAPPSARRPLHRNRWLRTLFFFGVAACVLVLVLDLPRTQNIIVDLPRGPQGAGITELEMLWSVSDSEPTIPEREREGIAAGNGAAPSKASSLGGTIWTFPGGAPRQVRTDLVVPDGHYRLEFRWSAAGPAGTKTTASDVHDVQFAGDGVHVYLKAEPR